MVWYFIEQGGTSLAPKLKSELLFKTYQVELGRISGPFLMSSLLCIITTTTTTAAAAVIVVVFVVDRW
jgi:hypothetical protein